jgi:acetolactate synthase I/II/III large subunit
MDDKNGQVLLISCLGEQTGGGLFTFDGETVDQIDTLSTTGLTLAGGRLGRLLWSSGEAGSMGELLIYDEAGVERYLRIDSLREPHDLAWDGQAFLAVSTLSNSVLWLSASGEVTRTWRADGDGDAWHLNSLFPVDDTMVAAAFGRFSKHREWSEGRAAGAGIVFDLMTGADVLSGLSCPHDPRLIDGSWLVCNSGEQELVIADASSGAVTRRVELDGWTRGLAVDRELIYVGESANRGTPVTGELARVAVIDRRTWSVVDRLPLACQEVFDVIQVPAALAGGVRQGFRTNPLRVGEQDQHALFRELGVRPARLWAVGEPLPVEACRVEIAAKLPDTLPRGTIQRAECRVTNKGSAILVSAAPNPVNVSYRWLEGPPGAPLAEGLRSPLPRPLPPEGVAECRVALEVPAIPGDYTIRVTLVQEQVRWFDEVDITNGWTMRLRVA